MVGYPEVLRSKEGRNVREGLNVHRWHPLELMYHKTVARILRILSDGVGVVGAGYGFVKTLWLLLLAQEGGRLRF